MTTQTAPSRPSALDAVAGLRQWPARRWLVAAVGALATALVVGIPTGVLPSSLYTRMTPVLWWNYPIWAVTALLGGLAIATYIRPTQGNTSRFAGMTGGGVLSAFAVGCPVCNKLVVAALGTSGALTIWAPLQPILGIAAAALLGYALLRRLQGELSCPVDRSDS